jgi:aminoglycoside/choline kinase family phosphotransferase
MLMPKENNLPDSLLKFVARRPGAELGRIRSEASRRRFYRINRGKKSLVAMVYPEPSRADVERFCTIQKIYRDHGLRVPGIEAILDDQVLIQEDAGDLLLQRAWRAAGRKERLRLIESSREVLVALAAVPPALATDRLDRARLKREMDFFVKNFVSRYPVRACREMELGANLATLVETIEPECVFTHRDFHSRNLLVHGREIVMVDFQDSLLAPRHYDLVSLAFDSYLDLGGFRELLLLGREWPTNEIRQLRLTALQRNIKALGTFAYQTYECQHPVYARYIPRTLRHICGHLRELADKKFEVLAKYFSAVTRGKQ